MQTSEQEIQDVTEWSNCLWEKQAM
jgi:hypothetical protein